MTKDKQKNNPKFAFLFGGQHYNYYQYKLTTEQQSMFWIYNVYKMIVFVCAVSVKILSVKNLIVIVLLEQHLII